MSYAKSADTQRRLIDATASLLRTRGYAATGLAHIVERSGVPKGSLYHHFPGGKEALAAAAVVHSGRRIRAALERMADECGDPARAVGMFCQYYVEQLTESDFRKGCPLATVALEAAAEVDAVHEACAGAFTGVTDLLTERLERAGLPPRTAADEAEFTVASIEGALLLAKARRDVRPLVVARDNLVARLDQRMRESKTGTGHTRGGNGGA